MLPTAQSRIRATIRIHPHRIVKKRRFIARCCAAFAHQRSAIMRMNQHPRFVVFIKRHRLHAIRRFVFRATRIAQHSDAKIRRLRNRQIQPLRAVFFKVAMIRIMPLQRLRIIHQRLMRFAQPRLFHIIVIKRISHHRQNGDDGYRNQQFNQSKAFVFHLLHHFAAVRTIRVGRRYSKVTICTTARTTNKGRNRRIVEQNQLIGSQIIC